MAINDILAKVNKVYGKGTMSIGVEVKDVKRLPTGIVSLDAILQGGLPFGRSIEIYGEESSGKSSTALAIIASAQKLYPEAYCAYFDAEGTYDPVYGELFGVDNDKLLYGSPENMSAEQCYNAIVDLIDSGECVVVVLDSIPSLESTQADGKDVTGVTMATVAGPLTKFVTKLQRVLLRHRDKTMFIGLNQLRDSFSQYGPQSRTPGGRSWRHATSVRLECKSVALDEKGNEIGKKVDNPYATQISLCKIKDKTCNQMGRGKIASYVISDNGVDLIFDLYNAAVRKGLIKTAGSQVRLIDSETGEIIHSMAGKDKFRSSLTEEHIEYLKSKLMGDYGDTSSEEQESDKE